MRDFKIKTEEALNALLNFKQFSFESISGDKKEKNQELFQKIVKHMPITEIDTGIYYRARIINACDGEDKGIFRENGIPVSGYNDQYSGVAPIHAIKENGRANRKGEQVLYLAEDIETTCKELKGDENAYISVAECDLKHKLKVMDFSIKVCDGLINQFSDDTVRSFSDEYHIDIRAFYIFIKEYLTSPVHKDKDYKVPLDFLDIVKGVNDISGIKYNSSYSEKCNIALWDENKNSKCTNSRVIVNR